MKKILALVLALMLSLSLVGAVAEKNIVVSLTAVSTDTHAKAVSTEVTDALGLVDSAVATSAKTHTDALGLADSIDVVVGHAHTVTDSLGLTDSVSVDYDV